MCAEGKLYRDDKLIGTALEIFDHLTLPHGGQFFPPGSAFFLTSSLVISAPIVTTTIFTFPMRIFSASMKDW